MSNTNVIIETSKGKLKLALDEKASPLTVANFLSYMNAKTYDGTIFHRVIKGFMVQGGGFTPDMKQNPTKPPIKNESGNGLKNVRGSIAMARTNDLHSATSQFFINTVDNAFLDSDQYCVFGNIVEGLEVLDAIANVKTGNKQGHENVPVETLSILSITAG